MIPVDPADYGTYGTRQGWCTSTAQPWWANENINISGPGVFGGTTVRVNRPVTIEVGIQPVDDPNDQALSPLTHGGAVTVQYIQAWAFHPSTADQFTYAMMLPSMQELFTENTAPTLANPTPVNDMDEYDAQPSLSLANNWTPTVSDIKTFSPDANELHCCVVAASSGYLGYPDDPGSHLGLTGLLPVTAEGDIANVPAACQSQYVGQKNISVIGGLLPVRGGVLKAEFGFLAAMPQSTDRTEISVEVRPAESETIRPPVLRALSGEPFRDLALRPAGGAKRLHLRPNAYAAEHFVGRSDPAEEIVPAGGEDIGSGHRRLKLRMPPQSIQPLLLEIELDDSLPGGSVFECDIIQTRPGGKVGGIRLAVVVPG